MDSEIVQAILLGVVQGVTEFFPVSSTAHLILFPWFFGWSGDVNSLVFDVALHAGTLAALLLCFYKEWINMMVRDRKTLLFILIATVPAGAAGVSFGDAVEHTLRNPLIVAFSTVTFGVVILLAERSGRKDKEATSFRDSLLIGIAQAMALIPGVSRSGITISAGLFRGLTRESAARFSFLLSTPVIGGAALLEGRKLLKHPDAYRLDAFLIGFLAAFVSGFFAIKFLLSFLRKHPLNIFVYYRFLLAIVIILMWTSVNGLGI